MKAKYLIKNKFVARRRLINFQWTDVDHKYFYEINTPEKAYWLGFLYADGCVYETRKDIYAMTLGLHEKDRDVLVSFKHDLKSSANIVRSNNGVGQKNAFKLTIYSHEMCLDLIKQGCMPRKTFLIKFPLLRENLYSHFIRGYFDGDGHVGFRKDRATPRLHISSNEQFIDELQEFLKQKGITSYKLKNRNIYRIEISAKQSVFDFYSFIYLNATRYMKRKKDVFDSVYANTETV